MHQEIRRRQMHMDRVCEARRRMALAQEQTYVSHGNGSLRLEMNTRLLPVLGKDIAL